MKLNFDCIRDTLLYLEDNLTIKYDDSKFGMLTLYQLTEQMQIIHKKKYTNEDIWYTVYNLIQAKYIEGHFENNGYVIMYKCYITNITWEGHQFLNDIRPDSIWQAASNRAKQIGGLSAKVLSTLSMSIAQAVATHPDYIQTAVDKINSSISQLGI